MDEIGKIVSLFISSREASKRIKKEHIELNLNGIIDDKFYGKNIERSVLLTSIESYQLAQNRGIAINHGELGENILINYNPYHLSSGTQIAIGEAILEISQHCTICKSLSKIDSKLPKLLKDDRGIFAKVIKSGMITKDDKLYILDLAIA